MSLKSIASAATIDMTGLLSAEITGTATINTITGVKDGASIVLYPAAAFVLGAGNISATTTTATVGKPIVLFARNSTLYEESRPYVSVPSTRAINTTAPLTGGGDLTADRTLAISDAAAGSKGIIQLAGDIGGTAAAPTVTKVTGTLSSYNAISTVNNGVGAEYASVKYTARGTDLAGVTLYTTPNPQAYAYRVSVIWGTNATGTAGATSVLVIAWTSASGKGRNLNVGTLNLTQTLAPVGASFLIDPGAAGAIAYTTTSTFNGATFDLVITLEAL